MADNIGYTPGTGAVVAADDIDGVLHQRMKLSVGENGVATDVSATNPLPASDNESSGLLRRILQMLMAPLGYDKSVQRQRGTVVVESGTVTAVTTVTNVTSLNTIDNYTARMLVLDQNRSAWAQCVRARIT